MLTQEKIQKKKRHFFTEDLDVTKWENVQKQVDLLMDEEIESAEDLILFLEKVGELSDILDEEEAWRYINMTRFADQKKYSDAFNEFQREIVSNLKPYIFKFNKKFYDSEYRKELSEKEYAHLNKYISNKIELFREENVPLEVKESELANEYGAEYSKLTVEYKGEEKTLSQLGVFLQDQDRSVRKEVWMLRVQKMMEVRTKLNQIFDEMKKLRIQQATNAGFDNYRDYMHQRKGRFSYTPADLLKFHDAVEKEVIPFLNELTCERKEKLKIDTVKPWDTNVDLDGKKLEPFSEVEDLIEKSVNILNKVRPQYGINLNKMKNSGFLDLENRKGKAPGGYNYPLQETGAPFIFMNAVGLHRNVVTLLHESGHAMHTFAMKNIKIDAYKHTPSEVAELASMAMEFITMDYWNEFYPNMQDFRKARIEQLEGALKFLPWCMIVDAFQHWIYTKPDHTMEERETYFAELMERFNNSIDWAELENYKKIMWLFQLHIFEVPFYYIEYGMSQLGALAIYRNYKKNGKEKTLEQYEKFLQLGYSKNVKELYETAGIKFDFSAEYLAELVAFVKDELTKIKG